MKSINNQIYLKMKNNNYFIYQLHRLKHLYCYQSYILKLFSKFQLSSSFFSFVSTILFCTFFLFISKDKASGQCSSYGFISWGSPEITSTNGEYSPNYYGFTNSIYIGGTPNVTGFIKMTLPNPSNIFNFEFQAFSNVPGIGVEHLEIWVEGELFDLNRATYYLTSTSVITPGPSAYVSSPGNVGLSGKIGVIEATRDGVNGSISITFPCSFRNIEIKNVHDTSPGGAGTFIKANYCSSPSTLRTCKNLAGNVAPTLSPTSITACSIAEIQSVTASNQPGGTSLTWHSGTPATTANKIDPTTLVNATGTYYIAFFDNLYNSYSPTSPIELLACCTDGKLVISKTKISDCPTNILASVKVFNTGNDVLPSGTPITFYDGDPRLGGATRIITYTNTPAIPANAIQSISDIDIGVCDMNTVHLFAVLGDNGSHPLPLNLSTPLSGAGYDDCDFTNNISGFKLRERCSQFGEIISK